MSAPQNCDSGRTQKKTAEAAFREAFERLKRGAPILLPKDTGVSQNNVAREAGCDPTALRKSRYPTLVAEIQHWVSQHEIEAQPSERQKTLKRQAYKRIQKEEIAALETQRDHCLTLLIEANATILEYSSQIADLRAQLESIRPSAKVFPYAKR